jgi:hypothetical protein
MENKIIILAAVIIAVGIFLSGGIYRFHTVQAGVVHRYNNFTGRVDLCVQNRGCNEFGNEED